MSKQRNNELDSLVNNALNYSHDVAGIQEAKRDYPLLVEGEVRAIIHRRYERHAEFVQNSAWILMRGLEKLRVMLDDRPQKGEFLGTWDVADFHGYRSWNLTKINPDEPESKAKALERLAFGRDSQAVFDNQVLVDANDSGDGSRETFYLGNVELCDNRISTNNHLYSNSAHYSIFGEAVTREAYQALRAQLDGLKGRDPHIQNELSEADSESIKVMRMSKVLDDATKIGQPGKIKLGRIYGGSYFGSGGGYGSVRAYQLSDWKKGVKTKLILKTEGTMDNGFGSGPKTVLIEPDMLVIALGGDSIGQGREWSEMYYCEGAQESVA